MVILRPQDHKPMTFLAWGPRIALGAAAPQLALAMLSSAALISVVVERNSGNHGESNGKANGRLNGNWDNRVVCGD